MIKEKEVIAEDDEVISPGKLEHDYDNISGYPGSCCYNMDKQDLADKKKKTTKKKTKKTKKTKTTKKTTKTKKKIVMMMMMM